MEEYVTIAEGARRLGVTTKRIQRAIKAGELPVRRPHLNKAEISMADLQIWFAGLHVRPGEMQDRLTELEARVGDLEAQLTELREQTQRIEELRLKRTPPKTNGVPPEGFTYLSDFCTLHHIPYRAAEELFPHMIRGQKITVRRRNYPVIGPKGRHDFWVQLHIRPDYVTCDDCPHLEEGSR